MKLKQVPMVALAAGMVFAAACAGLLLYANHLNHRYDRLADTHDLEDRIEKLGANYIGKRPNVGLVIAVYQHGRRYIRGFGKVSDTRPNPPDAQTLFEIGSITKVFTAVVLAKLVDRNLVKLEDPISLFLPTGVARPQKNGREITLLDLATHTSGLPRLPGNLFATMKDAQNPYANYLATSLYADLAQVKLASEPGEKSSYSNYGFGLLGHLLELKTGEPYEALVKETICAPLGMTNTTIELSAGQKEHFAQGHSSKGQPVPPWDLGVLAGCGAIRSTAEDMLKFAEANLAETNSAVSKVLAETQKVRFKDWMRGIGLGWQIEVLDDPVWFWHNGGTGGCRSFIGLNKAGQIGVVVLASAEDDVDSMATDILKSASKISME
jgi:CubicO group peptidase (beta-lactamase class C family)